MSHLSAAAAKKWVTLVRTSLKTLVQTYPLGCQPRELAVSSLPETTRYKILKKLVEAKFIEKGTGSIYIAIPEAAKAALQDDQVISAVLWPQKVPDLSQLVIPAEVAPEPPAETSTESRSSTETGPSTEPSPEPSISDQSLTLAPPPAIEGLKKPPPGAPNEVVLEWIFTILHAQTENMIYIREQVDKLLGQLL